MNIRKLSSVGLMMATVVVTVSGLTLYFKIGPHMPSLWAHIIFSITFILAVLIHMLLNMKPFLGYIKGRSAGVKELAVNILVAVAFTVWIVYLSAAPTATVTAYPTAELVSVEALLAVDGVTYEEGMRRLLDKGYKVPDGTVTLRTLASANKTNPMLLYGTMVPDKAQQN